MSTKSPRRRLSGDRGAQAVEFALVWSLALVPLILGLVQFGAAFYSQITITQAAREAVRQLALDVGTGTSGTCDSSCLTNAKSTAATAASPLTLKTSGGTYTFTACASGATQTNQATVTIQASSLLSIFFSMTVTGTASMPCGG